MKPDYDDIEARFNAAAWGIIGWERSDRDRPEGFAEWERWCREHAYYDIAALLDRTRLLEAALNTSLKLIGDRPDLRRVTQTEWLQYIEALDPVEADTAPVVIE